MIETIQIKPFVGQSPTGVKTYGPPRDVKGCKIWPRVSKEIDEGGAITDGLNIYVPPGADAVGVKATDRVLARGKEWEVDGVPGMYWPSSGQKVIFMTKKVGA